METERQQEAPQQEEKKTKKSRKATKSPTAQPKAQETSFKAELNAYGFIHLNAKLSEAWGVTKGKKIPVSIEVISDESLIVKKVE